MNALALPIAFMLFIVLAEACWLHWRRSADHDWRDTIFNLNSGHIVLWLFRGMEVALFGWIASHASLDWFTRMPVALQWTAGILAWDFCFYWLHRLHHRYRLLWAVHVVHHQGEKFNLSLGVRNSWYSSLTSIPFFLILALLGMPVEMFVAVSTLHYSIQLFNHNAVTPRLGWLEYLLVTPNHHRVHHGTHERYIDKNFGGSFIFWDKLFGTFERVHADAPLSYGVIGMAPSENPFRASNDPVLRYLGLKPANAAPAPRSTAPAWLVASGGIILFCVVVAYVWSEGQWPSWWSQAALFLLLACGTIALGGMSEGRRWGWRCWPLICLLVPAALAGAVLPGKTLTWLALSVPLAAHGLLACAYRYRALRLGRTSLPASGQLTVQPDLPVNTGTMRGPANAAQRP